MRVETGSKAVEGSSGPFSMNGLVEGLSILSLQTGQGERYRRSLLKYRGLLLRFFEIQKRPSLACLPSRTPRHEFTEHLETT